MFTKYLWVFFISMLPIVELRGAIPVGTGLGLPLLGIYLVAILGNLLPVPFIYLFGHRVLHFGAKHQRVLFFAKFCHFALEKGHRGGEKLKAKAGRGLFVALFLFVAIPLPGTGAWTGMLAASLLDMDFKSSIVACMAGVLVAGAIMLLASAGVLSALRLV